MFKENQIFTFLDFETTGIDTSSGTKVRPIEIGAIYTDYQLNKLYEYKSLIKWPEFMLWKEWPDEFQAAYNVHKIPVKRVQKKGKWQHEIVRDLIKIDKKIRKDGKYKPVVISDAPNFEMFFLQMLFGNRENENFIFHYNAWSIFPTFQLFDVKMGNKPHDALSDAQLMLEGMREVFKKAKELNIK